MNLKTNKTNWLSSMNMPSSELPKMEALLTNLEAQLIKSAQPKGVHRIFKIEKIKNNKVTLENSNIILEGKTISAHLESCHSLALMAATLGSETEMLIRKLQISNMNHGYILDKGASLMIEAFSTSYASEIKDALNIAGTTKQYTTFPYSPGYGDFSINYQKSFINVLDCQRRIGLTVTESNTLNPRKSITGIIGISNKKVAGKPATCQYCIIQDKCQLTTKGLKCYE